MRILEVELAAHDPAQLQAFYGEVFGFAVLEASAEQVCLAAGASRLCFRREATERPLRYHFAFDVPENQIEAAAAWLRARVPLIADSAGTEIFYSESWDAHNVYFRDPAGNIGELIARHTLASASGMPFDGASILYISEIGVAANDVRDTVAELAARTGATEYRGPGSASFSPVGDEHGLLIVVEPGRIWFPETGVPAEQLPLAVTVESAGAPLKLEFG